MSIITAVLLLGFAVAVVGLLAVTPALERWATAGPEPVETPATAREPLETARPA